MTTTKRLISLGVWIFVFAAITLLLPTGRAQAYFDPGSGSFILQFIIAGLLGFLVTIRMFWVQIKGFFKRLLSGNKAGDEQETDGLAQQEPNPLTDTDDE